MTSLEGVYYCTVDSLFIYSKSRISFDADVSDVDMRI
jgi:hypothetical protein